MANTKITTAVIKDDAITSAKIADDVALGGNPTTTTQSAGNNTTRIATTAFVTTAVSNLVDSAPSALDTLNELAAALGDDANFSTTITNSIATKLPLAGGTLTGGLVGTTAAFVKASSGGSATSGTVLTVEDDDNTELSILGGSSSLLAINFGHSGDNDEGKITFNTTAGSEDLQIVSSKEITLDATGQIILDADTQGSGNGILLKDAGTHYGSIFRSSSHLHIKAEAQDKNLLFLTNNGGSELTALTLASDGNATFSGSVTATNVTANNSAEGDTYFTGGTANSRLLSIFTSTNNGGANAGHNFKIASGQGAFIFGNATTADLLKVQTGGIAINGTVTAAGLTRINSVSGNSQSALLDLYGTNGGGFGGSSIARSRVESVTAGGAYNADMKFYTTDDSNNLDLALILDHDQVAHFSGDVKVLSGDVQMGNGRGINFSAFPTSATGSGSSVGSSTMTDFEEGTWVPTLIAGTTNPTGGGALAPSGTYTKIGNRVWVTFYVGRSWTNNPSGQVYLGNLPFTVHATSPNYYSASVVTYKVNFGTANFPFLIPNGNATSAALYSAANGGTWQSLTWQSHMASSAGSYISGTLHYYVA